MSRSNVETGIGRLLTRSVRMTLAVAFKPRFPDGC